MAFTVGVDVPLYQSRRSETDEPVRPAETLVRATCDKCPLSGRMEKEVGADVKTVNCLALFVDVPEPSKAFYTDAPVPVTAHPDTRSAVVQFANVSINPLVNDAAHELVGRALVAQRRAHPASVRHRRRRRRRRRRHVRTS